MTPTQPGVYAPNTDPSASPAVQDALKRLAGSMGDSGRGQEVVTRVADFLQLNPGVARNGGMPLDFLLDVALPVQAELGHTALPISKILELEPGSVLELDREVSQPVDLIVCGTVFARGEVVVIDGRFAVRIKEVLNPRPQKGGGKP